MTQAKEHQADGHGVTGIVLAGGRSSRMGMPKALLPFDGRPLIVHIAAALQYVCREIIVVASPGQDVPPLPAIVVRDEVAHRGPASGIYYGLRTARCHAAFVTACDSAFLNLDLIAHLLSQLAHYDVVVPHWRGRLQPLHAVYRTSVWPLLGEQLERGELRPVSLFERVKTCTIDETEIARFDPEGSSFFNMNTPEDYAAALEQWDRLHRGRAEQTT